MQVQQQKNWDPPKPARLQFRFGSVASTATVGDRNLKPAARLRVAAMFVLIARSFAVKSNCEAVKDGGNDDTTCMMLPGLSPTPESAGSRYIS